MQIEIANGTVSLEDGPEVFVVEKRKRAGTPWGFLCAFGDSLSARQWFQKPRKRTAEYRCRRLRFGEDVTARLTKEPAAKSM